MIMSGIDKFFEGIGDAVKTVPDIYEDGLKPSTREGGKTLALIPQTINAALAPLRIWIAQKEYNVAETEKILALKLEKVNAESIVSPDAYVAVPALQGIAYCMNSEELRNMYANLLATSMLKDKKENAHPSFVEIIKQLSPDEAKLLKRISESGDSYPLIDIKLNVAEGGYITQVRNFTLLAEGVCEYPNKVFTYIDNLERLKIIDIPFGVKLHNDEIYEPIESYAEIKNMLNSEVPEGYRWEVVRKKFEVTEYGKSFMEACVKNI